MIDARLAGKQLLKRTTFLLLWILLLPVGIVQAGEDSTPTGSTTPDPTGVARRIDELLAEELWKGRPVRPLPLVDDYTFLRRVSFDIIGRPPTPTAIRQFRQDSDPAKRIRIVEQLLERPEYGKNWANYWRDVIMYRRSESRALLAAGALTRDLATSLNGNEGWDEVARAFVTAKGNVQEDGSTAVIFAQGGRPEETVAELSRIFLGIQIQCAQCHDHPYDRWKREEFHELAAFFPRVSVRPVPRALGRGFSVQSVDFTPRRKALNDRYLGRAEHYMPDLGDPTAEGTQMAPKFFLTGATAPLGAPDIERRETLAAWITAPDNPWFSRALVNRIWCELIGCGFYEPVDDIGPDRECVAPKTLDFIANEFVAQGYDVKHLFRCITRTHAYQRESRSRDNLGERDFSCTYPQRLRSDQLFQALISVVDGGAFLRAPPAQVRGGPAGRGQPEQRFAFVFGFDPSDPRQEVTGSVPQALLMMNSPQFDRLFTASRRFGLYAMLRDFPSDTELLQELYLRTVSRPAESGEAKMALRYIHRAETRAAGVEDILWGLVNSAEFRYRR